MEKLLTVKEVAEIFCVTPGSIYNRVYRNQIPSIQFGGKRLFCRKELEKYFGINQAENNVKANTEKGIIKNGQKKALKKWFK